MAALARRILNEVDPIVIISILFLMLVLPLVIGDYNKATNDLRNYEIQAQREEQRGAQYARD